VDRGVDTIPQDPEAGLEVDDSSFVPLDEDDEDTPAPRNEPPRHVVTAEELYDVQQQSEFFVSLGQHNQAIGVLQDHIDANPETSAFAYLDLLKLLHTLGRREEYGRLQHEFEHTFNADVPDFDTFSQAGRGLEHYRGVLSRIEAQWPAPGTLGLIEELVFRKPGKREEAFDLPAYQELLLLYTVARDALEPGAAGAAAAVAVPPADSAETVIAPLHAVASVGAPPSIFGTIDHALQVDTMPMPPSAALAQVRSGAPGADERLGDIDLSGLDQTAYQTLRAPLEPAAAQPPADPHLIDFDPFDPATEDEIAPRPKIIKR
jgi:hypothetical protein